MGQDIVMIIAYLGMIIDHTGTILSTNETTRLITGFIGIALPIMCYYIAQNYRRTRHKERYLIHILIIGIISQYPWHFLNLSGSMFNDVLSLFIGIIFIELYNRDKLLLIAAMLTLTLNHYISFVPAYLVFVAWYTKEKEIPQAYWIIVIIISTLLSMTQPEWITWALCPVVIGLSKLINSRKRILPTTIKYIIYPGHLALLAIITSIQGV